jgi:hydroxyethylthiazole kinase-like uncharacterized protein yjeF
MHRELDTQLVTPDEMSAIDRDAAQSGIDSYGLMERAGQAVAAAALRRYPGAERFVVLCGPGNNGGDGYVAARCLVEAGAFVVVHALAEPARLHGDAATAFARYCGPVDLFSCCSPRPGDVIVDAIFGAGLSRNVSPEVARIIASVTELGLPVIAVDLPSGIDGSSGQVRGSAFRAETTLTFMCRKPGHALLPGRAHCGALEIVDIGIPGRIVARHSQHMRINGPDIWRMALPQLGDDSHKYRRGHLAVFSGGATASGAARLSASAGLKSGAGLVTVLASAEALAVNAAHLTAVMLKEVDDEAALKALLGDERLTTFVLGPGFGAPDIARTYALALSERRLVLDADGITAFQAQPETLFQAFAAGETRLVLTPHDGEFARLFPDLAGNAQMSKIDRARAAARRSHAIVVLKGGDTVIAAPDGRILVNIDAPAWLATAGSGDVLAGIIGAHLAQDMPAFEAAASAVWRHGDAGRRAGNGMTAEDLVMAIRPIPAR